MSPSPNGGKLSSMDRNKIDECTTNECPDVTPAQLLAEKPTPDDCRALERVMGRFNSTTGLLMALQQVLVDLADLEVDPVAKELDKFIPIMAQVEARDMNGTPQDPSPPAN